MVKKKECPFKSNYHPLIMHYECSKCGYNLNSPYDFDYCPSCDNPLKEAKYITDNVIGTPICDSNTTIINCRLTNCFCVGERVCPIMKRN